VQWRLLPLMIATLTTELINELALHMRREMWCTIHDTLQGRRAQFSGKYSGAAACSASWNSRTAAWLAS
jgi:hypothetical protein